MSFTKINISIPTEIEEKLNQLIEKGKKSFFIAECIREKFRAIEKEQLENSLKEGYSKPFSDSELWNNSIEDGLSQ